MYLPTALGAEKEIILYSLCSHINSMCSFMKLRAKMQAGYLQKGVPASLSLLSDPLAHFTKNLVLARLLQELSQFTKYRKLSTTTKSRIVFLYFDALVKLRVGQGCSWLEQGHREAAPTLLYTWELVGLVKCEAAAGFQKDNQLCKDTVLCKYQQLQSFHSRDLCIHSSC